MILFNTLNVVIKYFKFCVDFKIEISHQKRNERKSGRNFYYNNLALDFSTIELFFYYSGKIVTNAIRQQFFYFKKKIFILLIFGIKVNVHLLRCFCFHWKLPFNLGKLIGFENFVKIEKTEYLSIQLTYSHYDPKFIFPIINRSFEQFFIFWISKMFHISGSTIV